MGFGFNSVSSLKRVPKPPARITAFIDCSITPSIRIVTGMNLSGFITPAQRYPGGEYILSLNTHAAVAVAELHFSWCANSEVYCRYLQRHGIDV
jgi:hypothetical protein